jgi:hypothetical protein
MTLIYVTLDQMRFSSWNKVVGTPTIDLASMDIDGKGHVPSPFCCRTRAT